MAELLVSERLELQLKLPAMGVSLEKSDMNFLIAAAREKEARDMVKIELRAAPPIKTETARKGWIRSWLLVGLVALFYGAVVVLLIGTSA
ncbi:hypothetical protein [Pacificibacter marinus]|uniref:hypothetical protein n=1 Tax=Pacificibacter marinus TaxID=658057 RepID=UPI001C06BB2C|nr:hypothetical protein [Pacificibacter marinus]MBU2867027.1 hypothetical protein [Pacificibacter marinus]